MINAQGHTTTSSGLSARPPNSRTAIHMMAPERSISDCPKAESGGLFTTEEAATKAMPDAMTSCAVPHQPMSGLERSCHQMKQRTRPSTVVAANDTTEIVAISRVMRAPGSDPSSDRSAEHHSARGQLTGCLGIQ